jgi:hypothetical protein
LRTNDVNDNTFHFRSRFCTGTGRESVGKRLFHVRVTNAPASKACRLPAPRTCDLGRGGSKTQTEKVARFLSVALNKVTVPSRDGSLSFFFRFSVEIDFAEKLPILKLQFEKRRFMIYVSRNGFTVTVEPTSKPGPFLSLAVALLFADVPPLPLQSILTAPPADNISPDSDDSVCRK